ncbi:MAG: hypothetical protein ACREQN_16915 [Candidatus Binataceae bacterium]
MATLIRVAPTRLKSSFIYLANAVNDLRGNWTLLALVLAPLVIIAAFGLLPDALDLQHQLATKFAPGARNVGWIPAQMPYTPSVQDVAPLFPAWVLFLIHIILLALTFAVALLVLCTIRRIQSGGQRGQILNEAIAIYREAGALVPAFFWIVFLQLIVPVIAVVLLRMEFRVSVGWMVIALYLIEVAVLIFAALIFLWLYFAQYALIFDAKHGFHALLFSRDLMRQRFFRVATRIVVFLAVWSGYNSWAAGFFVVVSLIVGPVSVVTGYLWGTIFILDLAAVAVSFATVAFFVVAGLRLYKDLTANVADDALSNGEVVLSPAAPLDSATA